MVRLLRMPVVYVALLAAGLAAWFLLDTGGKPAESSGKIVSNKGEVAASRKVTVVDPSPDLTDTTVATDGAVAPAGAEGADGSSAILRTPAGLRRKVLVRELGLRPFVGPESGERLGEALEYFSILFVLGETARGQEPRMEVGTRDGKTLGWVPTRAVLEWDSRLMAVPTPRQQRSRSLLIYRDRQCLLDDLAGRACPRHERGRCPIEAEEPEQSTERGETPLGLPVLASEEIPLAEGTSRSIHEVAVLVRDLLPLPAPTEPPVALRQPLKQVYLAFVVDTTQSMETPIQAVRLFAARLAEEAQKRAQDLVFHVALLEYRDRDKVFGYLTKLVTDFTDPGAFKQSLTGMVSASKGDGSTAEGVMAGVRAALPGAAGPVRLSWPIGGATSQASTKLLILLGDAPDHEPGDAGARELADQAREAGITIAAVRLEPPPDRRVLTRGQQADYERQWQALAEGSYRPKDEETGEEMAGLEPVLRLNQGEWEGAALDREAALVAESLEGLVAERVKAALAQAARDQEEAERRLRDYANRENQTLEAVAPVLVDSHRYEEAPRARPDPRAGGVKAPSLRRGWVAGQWGEEAQVGLKVLISQEELDRLIEAYVAIQATASGEEAGIEELLRVGTAGAAGEVGFLGSDRGEMTLDEELRRYGGLPPGREDGLLRRTARDLSQSDDLIRAALSERLSALVSQLLRFRNSLAWDDPAQTWRGLALVPYEWLDF